MAKLTLDLPTEHVQQLKLRALNQGVAASHIVQALVDGYLQGTFEVDPTPIHQARRRGRGEATG